MYVCVCVAMLSFHFLDHLWLRKLDDNDLGG